MDESLGPDEPIDEAVFDLIEDTRRYVLAREAEIFAIWDLTTSADAPLATFPLDAEGEADARKEFHRLVASDRREHLLPRILLWAAGVAGVVWLIASAIFSIRLISEDAFGDGPTWLVRIQGLQTLANAVFFVAGGLYVLLWLDGRRGNR